MRSHRHIWQDLVNYLNPTFDKISLKTDYEITGNESQGELYWNSDEETMDLVNNGAITQVGQEFHYHVRNDSGQVLTHGDVVMGTGTVGASGRIKVKLFDPSITGAGTHAETALIGVVTEVIGIGEDGKVCSNGKVRGVDTSAWSEGDPLWVDPVTPGALTNVNPDNDQLGIILAFVISVHSQTGTLSVRTIPIDLHRRPHQLIGNYTDGDYAEFEDDGTLVLHGDATVWDDLKFPANNQQGKGSPTRTLYKGGYLLTLASNVDQGIYFEPQMTHAWKEGSTVEPHVHFILPTAGAGAGVENLKFDLTYSWANGNEDEVYPTETTISLTLDVQDYIADSHYIEKLPSIDGTGKKLSSMMICSLTRDVSVANDYASSIYLLEIDFHLENNTTGSRQEFIK